MPGRSFSSNSYKYGFNGQLKDDEISGSGNHIDFMERGLDTRLGRWWSIDKYFAKYPHQSPYAFVGNNPILNREKDGNDYGVYINHETKTIIIKATIYTPKGDLDANASAKNAAQFWNSQTGKYQYRVKTEKGYEFYDISFNITVVEDNGKDENGMGDQRGKKVADFDANGNEIIVKTDGNPESNTYEVVSDESKIIKRIAASQDNDVNGVAIAGSMVLIKKSRVGKSTEEHEVGHILGSGHVEGTVLSTSSEHNRHSVINFNVIRNILGNVGIGKKFSKSKSEGGKGTIVEEVGKAPDNFNNGNVTDK